MLRHPDHETDLSLHRKRVTLCWIEEVVVALNLCPFASSVIPAQAKATADSGPKRLLIDATLCDVSMTGEPKVEETGDDSYLQRQQRWLLHLIQYLQQMRSTVEPETVFLILPDDLADFDDYLDFLALAEALLADQGFEGEFQLASFHPQYCFDAAAADDAANYTNRSPYPMLQILRESSVEKAIESYHDVDEIPQQNIRLTRRMGLSKMQLLLRNAMNLQQSENPDSKAGDVNDQSGASHLQGRKH